MNPMNGDMGMGNKSEVLILTAQFGNGHLSVANALKQMLNECNIDIQVQIQDFFKMTRPRKYNQIYKNYEYLIKHGSWLYNSYYYSKEKFQPLKKIDTASLGVQKKLKYNLMTKKPKVIISTFPICSGYISKYKESYGEDIPLVTVITDIVSTNEWIYPHTNLYCVATQEVKEALINKGVSEALIEVTGIPIRKSFYESKKDFYDLDVLRQIPPHTKVITILGGGLGLLPKDESFYQWLNQLGNVHILIITGKNEKLYHHLKKKLQYKNITILGYTNKMHEVMRRSDLLVGKPGGITIFESIITEVPCIILKPTLGQEKENAKFIINQDIGFVVEDIKEFKEVVLKCLRDKDTIALCKERLRDISSNIEVKGFCNRVGHWL
jgi:UDP-N-acetylglucosamine:LPS N-acetylglucosamine transferase